MRRSLAVALLASLLAFVAASPAHSALDIEATGSDQWRVYASTPITTTPLTLAAWWKAESHAAVGTILEIGANGLAATEDSWSLRWTATPSLAARTAANGSSSQSVQTTGAADATWLHVAGTFNSATSRIAYINGAAASEQVTSRPAAGVDTISIGRTTLSDTPTNYADGIVAHAAIWNVTLTAQEVLSLANGAHPFNVRRDALVFYEPLTGHAADFVGQRAGTDNGAVAYVEGPPIRMGGPR